MTAFDSAIYRGMVMHRRARPKPHKLRYRIFTMLFDLDELDTLGRELRGFSRNRFNLFSFYDCDHGSGAALPLRKQIETRLREADIEISGGAIRLLCMPRVLGYVFNPLSVYFCHRPSGELAALLYEVNNTFGERHNYLIPVDAPEDGALLQSAGKAFHVSPFLPIAGLNYRFRVVRPADTVSIGVHVHDADGLIVTASLAAERTRLTNAALFKTFLMFPLLTLKVVAGIHWEALKLWLKGVGVHSKPVPPAGPVTLGSKGH